MTRRDEDRILHGLHYYKESIDEEFEVSCDQILWLAAHSHAEASGWHRGDDLQSIDSAVIPPELRKKLLVSKFELPLRYLHYRRLIKLAKSGEDLVTVSVTFAGADRAMRLHTRWGRIELWYREHRDGFFGLVTTALVSLITALLTVYAVQHLQGNLIEPARLIYAPDPKP